MEGVGEKGLKTKLIINYLPQNISDEQFRLLFSQIGPLESSKIMRDKATGYSFGYGFVDFAEPHHASDAINNLNGYQIENKTLRVAYSKPPGSSKNTNLFINGLGPQIDEEKLVVLFSKHGEVINTKILRDRDGSSKGSGFVLFKSKNEADAAIRAMQGYVDGYGSSFQIKYAKDSAEQQRSHPKYQEYVQSKYQQQVAVQQVVHDPYRTLGYGMVAYSTHANYADATAVGGYGGGYATVPYGTTELSGGQRSRGRGGGTRFNPIARPINGSVLVTPGTVAGDSNPIVLFVYNIGGEASDSDMYALFAKYGRITKVDVIEGRGYAFVHMPIHNEAQEAVRMLNGVEYNGKILQVSVKAKKQK